MISTMKTKYHNQKPLRRAAQQALESQGFRIEVRKGSGGARLDATKGGQSLSIAVRTSSNRWVGWMRDETGEFRAMTDDVDLIVVAALTQKVGVAEVLALKPADVQKAFNENRDGYLKARGKLNENAPIFVCLDPVPDGLGAAGSNLKSKAIWTLEIPISRAEVVAGADLSAREGNSDDGFIDRVRREFAERVGVPVEKVSVEFKVST